MPCTPGITPPSPTLPSPFSIPSPPTPPLPSDLTLCCKIVDFPPLPGLGSLGSAGIPPEVMAAIRGGVAEVLGFLDKIPLKCPRE